MGDRAFCGACGAELNADAKFCTSCGAPQDEFDRPPAPPASQAAGAEATVPLPPPPVAATAAAHGEQQAPRPQPRIPDRIEHVSPGANEFAGQLAAQLSTPGVAVALITAAVAAGACLAVGLILAVALPDTSRMSLELYFGSDAGTLTQAFGQMLSILLVSFGLGFENEKVHIGPLLLLAVPIGAAAVTAAAQASRTRELSPWARLAWAAGAGVPFALAVVIAVVVASDFNPSAGGAILLGILWVGAGAAIGTALSLRREGVQLREMLPESSLTPLRTAMAALRPLVLVLAIATVVGVGVAFVQTLRDEPSATGGGSIGASLVDYALLSGDIGVNYAILGAGGEFKADYPPPIPVDAGEVVDNTRRAGVLVAQLAPEPVAPIEEPDQRAFESDASYRLFDFGSAMAPFTFIPLLLILIGAVALSALYAGFSVARAAGAVTPASAVAFGALVGPIWSIVAVIANAMHVKSVGAPDGDSVFVMFLLGGAMLGALGGLLASNSEPSP